MKERYWDTLCKDEVQKKLLSRIRKNKVGQMTELLYDGTEYQYDDDDFTEIISRIGYQCGLYWQDLDGYMSRGKYPDNIKPSSVRTAEKWVRDAEDALGIPHNVYF